MIGCAWLDEQMTGDLPCSGAIHFYLRTAPVRLRRSMVAASHRTPIPHHPTLMSLHLKQPLFEVDRTPAVLPQEILDSLVPEKPPELSDFERPISRHLREALRSRGLNRRDLCRLVQWNSSNHAKSYRYIDAALDGSEIFEPFVRRAYAALDFTEAAVAKIMAEERKFRALDLNACSRIRRHQIYRKLGPNIYPMALIHWRPPQLGLSGDSHFYTRVPFLVADGKFTAPSTAEVSHAIAEPAPWFKPKPRECFGAYLYHRLPEEMAFLDMEGNLLSEGDTSLRFPPGVKRFG